MTIQNIIDTYNYAQATGCRLTARASEEVYNAILDHLNVAGNGRGPDHPVQTAFIRGLGEMPADFATFTGYRPRTKMLYWNYSELEVLRILYLLRPEDRRFEALHQQTRERIRKACFGSFCPSGECFEISVIALRYISSVFPEEKVWIDSLVRKIADSILKGQRKVSRRTVLMFCQVLTELRRDGDLETMDALITIIDCRSHKWVSDTSEAINDCILFSSLRRTPMAC